MSSPPIDSAHVLSRVTRRLIPFAFICYVVAYIDRVNIGFAARELKQDLGLSEWEYGLGAGLFFLSYSAFEIPSNLILEWVGARLWIARIMIVWGLVSMATMFITDVRSFMAARIILGIAEAGFFPGMVLYLTYWIPANERGRANALFMIAAPVSVIVGAPVSEAILSMHGLWGLRGWQWLFLLEGLPAVILGVMALKILTNRPEQADWLEPKQRDWLAATMNAERALRKDTGHASVGRSLRSGRVWLLSIIYLMNASVTYGIFLFLPLMLQATAGPGVSVGWLTALPFVAALIAMVLIGRHSDKTGERKFHVAACAITAAIGLFLAVAFQNHLYLLVLAFAICQVGQRSIMSVFWTMPPMLLSGAAAAAGIALINAIGNLGGFFGPTVMGTLRDATGGYTGGLLVLAGALILEAILVSILKLPNTVSAPRGAQPAAR